MVLRRPGVVLLLMMVLAGPRLPCVMMLMRGVGVVWRLAACVQRSRAEKQKRSGKDTRKKANVHE